MRHMMIDIETLDTNPTAVITAIGAKFFDLDDMEGGEEFYQNIDIQSCLDVGLTVKGDTLAFWMNQNREARMAMFGNELELEPALQRFFKFVKTNRKNKFCTWSHATFDVPAIGYAASRVGLFLPWSFRENRDIRTLNWLTRARPKNEVERTGEHHNALDDVRHQINYMVPMLKYIKEVEHRGQDAPF